MKLRGPLSMQPHVEKVLKGEYDIDYSHPDPVIIDVGANIGAFAFWASERWPGAMIHCYEPVPETFEILLENLQQLPRYSVHNQAFGDPTRYVMFLGRHNCGEASFYKTFEQSDNTVEVQTLHPANLPKGNILKLDVEGSEVEILSMIPKIEYDVILVEYHSEEDRRQVDNILKDYILVGATGVNGRRGVVKYLHRRLVKF